MREGSQVPKNDDVRWHKLMIFHIQFIRGGAKASGMAMAMANNAAARFQFRHHMPFNPNLLHGLPQPLRPSKKYDVLVSLDQHVRIDQYRCVN